MHETVQSATKRSVDAMLSMLGRAPRLAQSSAAKSGIAFGLAALLGAPHLLPSRAAAMSAPGCLLASPDTAGAAKQALQVRGSRSEVTPKSWQREFPAVGALAPVKVSYNVGGARLLISSTAASFLGLT